MTFRHRPLPPRLRPAPLPRVEPLAPRLLFAAGDFDPSFGDGGTLTLDTMQSVPPGPGGPAFTRATIAARDFVTAPDGSLYVVGVTENGSNTFQPFTVAVTHLTPAGALDPDFGPDAGRLYLDDDHHGIGAPRTDAPDGAHPLFIDLDPAGNILVAGTAIDPVTGAAGGGIELLRIPADGNLVPFAALPATTVNPPDPFSGDLVSASALAVDPEGAPVVAGRIDHPVSHVDSFGNPTSEPFVTRFLPPRPGDDGDPRTTGPQPDPAFGAAGTAHFSISAFDDPAALAVAPDHSLYVAVNAGYTNDGVTLNRTPWIVHLRPDGTQVYDFVPTDFEPPLLGFQATALALQPDGKLLLAAAPDTRVYSDGVTPLPFAPPTASYTSDFTLFRFNPDGALDAAFGSAGVATADFGNTVDRATDLALFHDGKILATGRRAASAATLDVTVPALARFNPDGSPDTSFGQAGQASPPLPSNAPAALRPLAAASDQDLTQQFEAFLRDITGRADLFQSTGAVLLLAESNAIRISRIQGDGSAPTVQAAFADVLTAGVPVAVFQLTFTDDFAVTAASILAAGDAVLLLPPGASTPAFTAHLDPLTDPTDGSPRTATYRLTPSPAGAAFTPADNATYTVRFRGGITDPAGNASPAGDLGAFTIAVPTDPGNPGNPTGPSDATPPTAAIPTPLPAPAAAADTYVFTVTYADDVAPDPATFGNDDVLVTGPNGFSAPASLVSHTATTAAYAFTPPGGAWDPADDGAYTLALRADAVRDAAGNPAAATTLATLTAAFVADTPLLDTDLGSASPAAPNLTLSSLAFKKLRLTNGLLLGGSAVSAALSLRNTGRAPATGTATVSLYLSTDPTPSSADTLLKTIPILLGALKPNKSKSAKFSFTLPADATGPRTVVAVITPTSTESTTLDNARAAAPLNLAAPHTDLAALALKPKRGKPNKPSSAKLTLKNTGTAPVIRAVPITLTFTDAADGATTTLLTTAPRLNLAPGKSKSLTLKFTLPPALATHPGTLTATLDPTDTLAQSDPTNDTARAPFHAPSPHPTPRASMPIPPSYRPRTGWPHRGTPQLSFPRHPPFVTRSFGH